MRLIRASDLGRLDVVSLEDGRYLGNVCDLDLDPQTGRINALVVEEGRPFWFWAGWRRTDLEIPWRDVALVGVDVVLVKNRTWKG